MRAITTVANKMLEIIPLDETKLRNAITEYISTLWNIAPEALSDRRYFIYMADLLNDHLRDDLTVDSAPWKLALVKLFNDD